MALISTAILGASGYTGAELLRLLVNHPAFRVVALTADKSAGKPIGEVYPHLQFSKLPDLVPHSEVDFSAIDLVFCCLPHGTTQPIIASLPEHVKIVDLSADFRLQDAESYAEWYGHAHQAEALQKHAVYGLTEHARDAVSATRLVANPGCYPTCSLLPLLPLVKQRLIDANAITINALSGISGAGRSAKQAMLFSERDGGVSAYGVGNHRHMAEIEQELSLAHGASLRIGFTPHLVPMSRGMLATITVPLASGVSSDTVRECLSNTYRDEPFVKILAPGLSPESQHVRGTNQCHIAVHASRRKGEVIMVSVIDNLVKGASGQAIQNANRMFNFHETTALTLEAVFP
jgi:N-acetyl-gamma-glutamyl-phosphate reductase